MSLVYETVPPNVQNEGEKHALKACRGCLDTEIRLVDLHEVGLAQLFGEFTGIAVIPSDGYPQHVCGLCLFLLRKFFTFRMRCHSAMYMLQQVRINNSVITTDVLKSVERRHLKVNLIVTEISNIDYVENKENIDLTENPLSSDDISYDADDKSLLQLCIDLKRDEKEEQLNNGEVKCGEQHFDYDIKIEMTNEEDVIDFESDVEPKIKGKRKSKRKKAVSKTVKKMGKVRTRNTAKLKRKVKKNKIVDTFVEERDMYVTDVWETIMKEINEENSRAKIAKRKPIVKDDIKHLAKQADKISKAYNVEVKFLTAEEQRRELEQKRRTDSFLTGPFKCELCVKVFITEDTYKRHTVQHDPEKTFECEVCRYTFKNIRMYRNHYNALHMKKIICKECGILNRHWPDAKRHYQWHKGTKIHCEHCDMSFSVRKLYMMHLRNKHHVGATQCALCRKMFIGDVGLKIHMDKIHKLAVRCAACDACFNDEDALHRHTDSATDIGCSPDVSSCPMCGVNFLSEKMMKEHVDEMHKQIFKCEQCNKCMDTEKQYKSHALRHLYANRKEMENSEPMEPDKYAKCEDCETEKLCYHRKHGADKPYKCTQCKRSFYHSQSLKKHMRKHQGTESKGFICEVCGKEKPSLAHLKYHQRTHTGEKPYKCNLCNKGFAQNQTLKCHMATHTGERAYKCAQCAKAFIQPAHLRAHMWTHTKERPYACNVCEKRYRSATSLKEHKDTAHRGLPHRQWGKRNKRT